MLRDELNRQTQLGIDEEVRITTEVADALDYAPRLITSPTSIPVIRR